MQRETRADQARLWHAALLGLLSFATAGAAEAQNAAPSADPIRARVDAVFAAYDKDDSPGCALGVYRNGAIDYARGYGKADLQAGTPITSRTVFDIGSTSKQFTAASIVLLAQQGKLSLDDDVRRYIPELPEYQKPITIRQLLHHTSGVRDYIGLLMLGGAKVDELATAQQALDAIVRQKALNFDPGSEHLYSNSGYFLLSQIVERVSGKSLRQFAEEQIFKPLGMVNTHFHDDHRMPMPTRATGYSPSQSGFQVAMSPWEQTGDGAVNTTIEDLLHWDRNFYEPKVGGAALLTQLQTKGTLTDGTQLDYAVGLIIEDFRGLRAVSHGGAWAGYRAELIRFPDEKLSVATLCNVANANPSALARQVAAIYLEEKLAPAAQRAAAEQPARVSVPAAQLSQWAATYRNPATGTLRVVSLDGEKLMATFGQTREEMVPQSATEFTVVSGQNALRLRLERDGDRRRMRQYLDGREVAIFEEIRYVDRTADELQKYAGTYSSEELNATFTVVFQGSTLMLRLPSGQQASLRALEGDEFMVGGVNLKFSADAQGRPSTFLFSQGRVRGVRFDRISEPPDQPRSDTGK